VQARHGVTSPDLGPSTSVTQAAMIINLWTNHANVNNSAELERFVNGRLRWGTLDADWSWVLINAVTVQVKTIQNHISGNPTAGVENLSPQVCYKIGARFEGRPVRGLRIVVKLNSVFPFPVNLSRGLPTNLSTRGRTANLKWRGRCQDREKVTSKFFAPATTTAVQRNGQSNSSR